MKSVLFVDDELNVLHGLRRMTHELRRDWRLAFVSSGEDALKLFAEEPFDILVSDLRMPGMDGFELLQHIRDRWPETVRIALSGYSDRQATLRALSHIHQYLNKPCEPEALCEALQHAALLGALLQDERLKKVVSTMQTLPSLEAVFNEVSELLDAPDVALSEVGRSIARDAGMSAKVLHVVNSAAFGMQDVIGSPVHGTILLGLDIMRQLFFGVKLFDQFSPEEVAGESLPEVWAHSLAVARVAKELTLAEGQDGLMAENAFLAGLLHDVGRLVFAANFPDEYCACRKLAKGRVDVMDHLENKLLGAGHGEVAAYLVGLWGLSQKIIEAMAYHHTPSRISCEGFSTITAVHVADILCGDTDYEGKKASHIPFDMAHLESIGLAERIPDWQKTCSETLRKEKAE